MIGTTEDIGSVTGIGHISRCVITLHFQALHIAMVSFYFSIFLVFSFFLANGGNSRSAVGFSLTQADD